ncbi:hypothetical protein [Xanthomarina gelatinilytica]|uniref:hypothetical protein n=1 Tax=Xanthomarina gelatinilytica TaxID=1137281 RepID=UPI003AA9387C
MNKAISGNEQEVVYTKQLNRKDKFWDKINHDKNTTYAIHVISKKYGKINEAKIQPKADIILAKGNIPLDYLSKNDFYLNEKDIKRFNLTLINESGISVKLPNSKYTITKISPNTFIKIYGSNLLGAGASIYCNKEKDFSKNIEVLNGWSVQENDFYNYFNQKIKNLSINNLNDKEKLAQIKTFSNHQISKLTLNSKKISDLIFKGIGNFEEPYTAHYIIENDEIKENYYIPFSITTGSGRSKGTFTIVFKPQSN